VGFGELRAAVADAGLLIHLAEIGCLDFLRMFDALHVADAIWHETVGQSHLSQDELLGLRIVQRHELTRVRVAQFAKSNGLESLHDGEMECLFLCRRIGVSVLLTDDLAVREAAGLLKITPVGSLGIVIRAYRLGDISLIEAERHIADLYDMSSLFVTRAIADLAIQELRRRTT